MHSSHPLSLTARTIEPANQQASEGTMEMKVRTRLITGAVSVMSLLGGGMATAQDADIQAQVEQATQHYEEVVAAGDWDALGSMMTENAIYLPSTGGMAEGREAIQAHHEQMGLEAIDVRSSSTEVVGETLILDFGVFTATLPEAAGGGTLEGEYVTLYEQGESGLVARSLTAFPMRQAPEAPGQE